jgi:hypothetical protein
MDSPKTLKFKKLSTKTGKWFMYSGNVNNGTIILYGKDFLNGMEITKEHYLALTNHFKGKTVNLGSSRNKRKEATLGEWIAENITKTAIVSYIVPILIKYKRVKEIKDTSYIKFM